MRNLNWRFCEHHCQLSSFGKLIAELTGAESIYFTRCLCCCPIFLRSRQGKRPTTEPITNSSFSTAMVRLFMSCHTRMRFICQILILKSQHWTLSVEWSCNHLALRLMWIGHIIFWDFLGMDLLYSQIRFSCVTPEWLVCAWLFYILNTKHIV